MSIKRDSLKKNLFFQIFYQVVMLVVPLVLAPYLTRTLGSVALGTYTYVHSIAYYFVLFAMLGIAKYGQRVIAQNADNIIDLRKAFWGLLKLHMFFSLLAIVAYFAFISLFVQENHTIYYIDGLFVASALFDISWFFCGIENFRQVVYRNLIVKIVECVAIFLFVKSSTDVSTYTFIIGVSIFLGQAVMLPIAIRDVPYISTSFVELKEHLKPLFTFALAVFAVSIYTIFDKTLLGLFASKSDVAFFEYSDRIVKIPLAFIAVAGTILLPRSSSLVKLGDDSKQNNYFSLALIYTTLIASLSFWVLCNVAEKVAVGYYGEEFRPCGNIMIWLSPIIMIVGIGEIVRSQFLIPHSMDRQYIISICLNALISLVVNASLLNVLPDSYKIYGIIIGTITAEFCGTAYQFVVCRKLIKFKYVIYPIIASLVPGFIMFLIVDMIDFNNPNLLIEAVAEALLGIIIYFILYIPSMFFIYRSGYNNIIALLPLKRIRGQKIK